MELSQSQKELTMGDETLNFDSRNRDTLSVISGVGTLRKAYAGPLDQLTRMWYDTPVDSIGGVNGDVFGAAEQLAEIGILLLALAVRSSLPWWRG